MTFDDIFGKFDIWGINLRTLLQFCSFFTPKCGINALLYLVFYHNSFVMPLILSFDYMAQLHLVIDEHDVTDVHDWGKRAEKKSLLSRAFICMVSFVSMTFH